VKARLMYHTGLKRFAILAVSLVEASRGRAPILLAFVVGVCSDAPAFLDPADLAGEEDGFAFDKI